MTTILGKQFEDGFILAADTQVTVGEAAYCSPTMSKIVKLGGFWIGAAGDASVCDAIQHLWKPVKIPEGVDEYHFMISSVVPSLRKLLVDRGIKQEDTTALFLFGFNKKLFLVNDWTVLVSEDDIYAIGSGAQYALGALEAGADVHKAMRIAKKFDLNTGGPVQVVKEGVTNG